MLKACIFDLDGVVVDTATYHYKAWKKLANNLGFDFTEQQNELLKGVSRVKSLEIILEIGNYKASQEEKDEMARIKNECYLEFINKMSPNDVLPGVKNILLELKNNGIKTAIGSASKNAKTILNKIQIIDLFDTIIDGESVSKAKPDPEVFLKAARNLNINPINCIVFEDAVAGIEAAKNAQMYCIGIGNKDVLTKADMVIPNFKTITLTNLKSLIK